jgi:hypothetical protein
MSRHPLFAILLLPALIGIAGIVPSTLAATSATPGSGIYQPRSSLAYLAGTRVTITAIDSSDPLLALYPASTFIGREGVVYESSSNNNKLVSQDGGTWWGGPVLLDGDTSPAPFTKIQVTSTATPILVIDTTPLLFALMPVTDAIPNAYVLSNTVKVQGIEADTDINITGGEYAIDGGTWTSASGTVGLNQTVTVRVMAPDGFGATASATLTIGGISSTFDVTTVTTPGDYSPDNFSFATVSKVTPGTVVVSPTTVTVAGITATTPISVIGGEYSINGGAWTSVRGTVALGNQVKLRLTAPAGYDATGTATLTIGDVSASFQVSTRSFTAVTATTEVFANAGTAASVVDGVIRVTTPPTTPLQLTTGATLNAVVALDTTGQIPVLSGTNVINIAGQTADTTMQVVNVGGTPALVPISGSVGISAPQGNTIIPVTGSGTGSASVLTSAPNTSVVAGPSATTSGNFVVSVSSGGAVTYSATSRGRAVPASFSVYPGEAVLADEAGTAGQVRLGSFAQDGSQAGDFIANLPNAAGSLSVPLVSGASQRFNNTDWATLVGQAIASKLGLGTFVSLSQDAASGVMTLVTASGTYRFLPVGSLALADAALNGGSRAVSVAAIAANLTAILDSSLSFAVAPATAYADLKTALQNIGGSLEILGDGVLRASLQGTDYIAQPASATVEGTVTAGVCPGFDTVDNQLALCDSSGKRQLLHAAFADTDTLVSTFTAVLGSLSVSNTGADGLYSTTFSGSTFSLAPDITLSSPPADQAGKLWWVDASGKVYIRYPSGAAQGFSLQQ